MKILAVADIHGDLNLVRKVEKLAKKENIDMILLGGDQTWFEQKVDGLVKPLTYPKALMIHGNHEPESLVKKWEEMYSNLKNLHKKYHIEDNIGFFGSGTTDWGFVNDEKQVFKELNQAHKNIKHLDKKVMLTHCPPSGSKVELLGFPGSRGVRKAIDKFKPDIVICGHIHEGSGLREKFGNTKVINVARYPYIFEI